MSQRIGILIFEFLKFYRVEGGWKFMIGIMNRGLNRRSSVFYKKISANTLDMRIPVKDEDIDKLIEEVEDHLGRI